MPGEQNVPMLQSATVETTAPCPKCRSDMVLAVITRHPVAPQLGKHTYLCVRCNQTRAYILPTDAAAEARDTDQPDSGETDSDRRRAPHAEQDQREADHMIAHQRLAEQRAGQQRTENRDEMQEDPGPVRPDQFHAARPAHEGNDRREERYEGDRPERQHRWLQPEA